MRNDTVYVCDVNKNKQCPKTYCYINGGECRHTSKIEYALYDKHFEFECWLEDGECFKMEKISEDNQ